MTREETFEETPLGQALEESANIREEIRDILAERRAILDVTMPQRVASIVKELARYRTSEIERMLKSE